MLRARALNGYIYNSMIDAAASPDLSDDVSGIIAKGLCEAPEHGVLNPHLAALGFAGAEQVAQIVRQVVSQRRQQKS